MARVGKFVVNGSSIVGPAEYVGSASYTRTVRQIEDGTHCLIAAAPAGISIEALVGTILQTDYAAWLGQREFDTYSRRALLAR